MIYKNIIITLLMIISASIQAATWSTVNSQIKESNLTWRYVVCEAGAGWRNCELPLSISLEAVPNSVVGFYPGSIESESTITATVRDYFGNLIETSVTLEWETNFGTLSTNKTITNSTGTSQILFKAPAALGTANVKVHSPEYGGSASISITLSDKWMPSTPTFTPWVDVGSIYGCKNWTPSSQTVNQGVTFIQTATDCKQDQERFKQEREISMVTDIYRNQGAPLRELRTAGNIHLTRSAVGSKTSTQCAFSDPSYTGNGYSAFYWAEHEMIGNKPPEWDYFQTHIYAVNNPLLPGPGIMGVDIDGWPIIRTPFRGMVYREPDGKVRYRHNGKVYLLSMGKYVWTRPYKRDSYNYYYPYHVHRYELCVTLE